MSNEVHGWTLNANGTWTHPDYDCEIVVSFGSFGLSSFNRRKRVFIVKLSPSQELGRFGSFSQAMEYVMTSHKI